ncbi:hypothetical protein LEMLEM_LOCUS12516 [Lemmus lemmus]
MSVSYSQFEWSSPHPQSFLHSNNYPGISRSTSKNPLLILGKELLQECQRHSGPMLNSSKPHTDTQIPNHVSTGNLGSVRVRANKGPLQSWRLVGKPGRSAHRGPRPASGLRDATHPPIPPCPSPGPLPAPRELRSSSADSWWGRHPRTCCQGSAPGLAPPPPAARDLLPRPAPPHGLPRAQPDLAEIPGALKSQEILEFWVKSPHPCSPSLADKVTQSTAEKTRRR